MRIYDNYKYFDLVFFINNEGELLFSKPVNEEAYVKYNYRDRDYFGQVMTSGKSCISNLHMSRVLGELHFLIASPVFDKDSNIAGLVGAGIPLCNIEMLAEKGKTNFDGKIYIIDQLGTLLIHPEMANIKQVSKMHDYPIVSPEAIDKLDNIRKSNEKTTLSYRKGGDVQYHSAISFVEEVDWMIIAEQSEDAILKETIWLGRRLKIVTVYLLIAVLIIGLILANKITKPIEGLMREVRKFGHGSEAVNFVKIESSNEIGELSSAFNDMSILLKEKVNKLNESYTRENYYRQYLDNILKSLGSGIVVADAEGFITIFNNAAEQITGFSKDEIVGANIDDFFSMIHLNVRDMVAEILEKREQAIVLERTIVGKDGINTPINLSISPVIQSDSQITGIIYLVSDISRAREMEEELSRVDRIHILGELSSSLIHDIGNPLAGMRNLLELLKANLEVEELRGEIIRRLNTEISDLNALVVDFLSFSRESSLGKSDTDMFNLVDEVINLLKPELINKNIRLRKDFAGTDNRMISVNRNNIKHALINVLMNCIQASEENGVVYVTVQACCDVVRVYIKDNGPGINKEDIEKVFEPFYTTKKGGTGLGLSSTYKIIKEHGGRITVNSPPGEGTQFDIVLER